MTVQAGIVGLPNVGKSTLFNALTKAGAEAANYPFCTIEPNVGVVTVPDPRLAALAFLSQPKKVVPAVVRFVDIAGLVRGASRGEGLGNKFLAHIREVDAVIQVVRCFADPDVTHVDGPVDPVRDMETIALELVLADLETVERRIERVQKMLKARDKQALAEMAVLEKLKAAFLAEKPARALPWTAAEAPIVRSLFLLTSKPVLYVFNVGEADLAGVEDPLVATGRRRAEQEGAGALVISGKMEAEIAELVNPEERQLFLAEMGLPESGLERLIRETYTLLGLSTFFTTGPPETRAWTIANGTRAPQAAGVIHSDIERGFIRAEVVGIDQLLAAGSMAAVREKGLQRLEGKEYVMQDGDVVYFRFNI
ncbi:MAG: redox-regulated ATPase YchF [Heliobacteriaceae bacterium]|nr:redox-regulated ATPase YchF [Heliobacteriaceae bacterium]MDD4588244.1 redox-regulated ATPase YchF [Heliobacteriaceae bacterium]